MMGEQSFQSQVILFLCISSMNNVVFKLGLCLIHFGFQSSQLLAKASS
jgi:hypothetical protein